MKNLVLYLVLLPAIITSCAGSGKESVQDNQDSIVTENPTEKADEIQAESEQSRLDSLRLDSIARMEKRMAEFGPGLFLDNEGFLKKNIPSALKKDGFEFVSKKYEKTLFVLVAAILMGKNWYPVIG